MTNRSMVSASLRDAATFESSIPAELSISDPRLVARFLGMTDVDATTVTEHRALGLSAFYRGCSIIAGTIAGLPLKTYETDAEDKRSRVPSFLDNPAGPYELSDFSWKETVILHLVIHNESYLCHIRNAAGELIGLYPVHPAAIGDVTWSGTEKRFPTNMADGTVRVLSSNGEMTQVLGLSTDGLRGVSLLETMRRGIQTGMAGEIAANRTMTSGMLVGGLVAPDTDMDGDQSTALKAEIVDKMLGPERAGDVMVVNRALKFSPWTMTNADAQFIESRSFQVEEFARMLGIPTSLMSVNGAVSMWGTGQAEAAKGLATYTLSPYTSRLEAALKRLLPEGQHAEFDWKGLLQGTPAEEINLLLAEVSGGLITVDEARGIMNLGPKPIEAQLAVPPSV